MLACNFCKTESDNFYTAANNDGTWALYCGDCYQKFVVDNYEGIVPNLIKYDGPKCECGTKAKLGRNHSSWCDLYVDEF